MSSKKYGKNANYNFADQKEPRKRMGEGDFANMPSSVKYLRFKENAGYRDGILNNFTCDVEDVSGIYENERSP